MYIYKHTPILYIYISNRFFFIWFVCKSLGVDAMDGSMFVRKHVLDGAGLVIFFFSFFLKNKAREIFEIRLDGRVAHVRRPCLVLVVARVPEV